MEVIEQLEKWRNASKSRAVTIEIDDGYGATCWRVELHQGKNAIHCSETNFVESEGVDPRWHEHEGDLWCCVVDGDEMNGWPGLAATIERALECAELFWKKEESKS